MRGGLSQPSASRQAVDPVAEAAAARILSVDELRLHSFRNYPTLQLATEGRNVVLTGQNGAGKTNILEAVSMLVPGRGLRKARFSDIDNVQYDQSWVVSATVQGMQGECTLGVGHEGDSSRTVKIDDYNPRSQAELGKHLTMLWLTPQMEQLFNQGTSEGRRFLDRLVYSFDSDHASRVNKYDYAMRERNRLLQDGAGDAAWLDTLELTMAETATAVAQARLDTLSSLNHAMGLSTRPFPKAQISVQGAVEGLLQSGMSALEAEEGFKAQLTTQRRQDSAAGRTLYGTHVSQLSVFHQEKQMPAEHCSTGEQKALLLSIILAQTRAAALWKQTVPILVFDDVSAHLDSVRKHELFDEIYAIKAQTWMTGTDPQFFSELDGKALFFHVDNGTLR